VSSELHDNCNLYNSKVVVSRETTIYFSLPALFFHIDKIHI
jgi:hypothetical protein